MYSDKFKTALAKTLVFEGGKDDDPHDPGGRTAYGIIQSEYNKWRLKNGKSKQDVWKIAYPEIETIYWENYWVPMGCEELPYGTDFVVFDAAVNTGLFQATKDIQRALGTVVVDGKMGPICRSALMASDPKTFIAAFGAKRLAFYRKLAGFGRFGRGWTSRVIEGHAFARKRTTTSVPVVAPKVVTAVKPVTPTANKQTYVSWLFSKLISKS